MLQCNVTRRGRRSASLCTIVMSEAHEETLCLDRFKPHISLRLQVDASKWRRQLPSPAKIALQRRHTIQQLQVAPFYVPLLESASQSATAFTSTYMGIDFPSARAAAQDDLECARALMLGGS